MIGRRGTILRTSLYVDEVNAFVLPFKEDIQTLSSGAFQKDNKFRDKLS
jgi:hypothetical protein